ncbi:MAG: phosphatidylserine decarboxylase [Candidatus Thiodiazotropha sp.]
MKIPSTLGVVLVVFTVTASLSSIAGTDACDTPERQPATRQLIDLVKHDKELKKSLQESIALGQRINSDQHTNPVASLEDYYGFIDALTTYDPRNIDTGIGRKGIRISMDGKNYCNWNILDMLSYSYFLVDRQLTTDPRGQVQFKNRKFSDWMRQVAENWGGYLETPASAKYIPSFENDPNFGNWYCHPKDKPYSTFQDFFTRELCPESFPTGSRPVEGYADPKTIVSIGDSNSMGYWPISDEGRLVTGYDGVSQAGRLIKGKLYSDIHEFILGGPDETVLKQFGKIDPGIFDRGVFTHQFLNVNNYHRLHLPVAGKLVFMRHIKSATRMKSSWKPALGKKDVAYYDPEDTPDWQFGQTRLVLGIKTEKYGFVIATPMGMAQVSAIRLRNWVKEGADAKKGWEFANFAFGGSDFVIIFEEKAKFRLTVPHTAAVSPGAGVNYEPSLQGQKYGCFGGGGDCSDKAVFPPPYPR